MIDLRGCRMHPRFSFERTTSCDPIFLFSEEKKYRVARDKEKSRLQSKDNRQAVIFHRKGKHRANWYKRACALRRLLAPCALRAILKISARRGRQDEQENR